MRSSDFLFRLIKSLTKGDRRNFKLFARLQDGDKKYIRLFDAIDKQSVYDEKKLLKHFKGERFTKQFSVAKNYLYHYILKTLHIFHKDQHVELNILLHQVQILMGKNLFDQAQKVLRKAKHCAERQERFHEMLYLLQYERQILYHTQNIKQYAVFIGEIQRKEAETLDKLNNIMAYKPLHDEVFLTLKKAIAARVADEAEALDHVIGHKLMADASAAISQRARIKRLDILIDCYLYKNNIVKCLELSEEIVTCYEDNPEILKENNIYYITNLNNQGVYQFKLGNLAAAEATLDKLRKVTVHSEQELIRVMETYYAFRLLIDLDTNQMDKARQVIEDYEDNQKDLSGKIRKSTELTIFYYSAYLLLMDGRPTEALKWINKLLNEPKTELRIDLQCMARILNLLIHEEIGNKDFLDYNIKSASRFVSNRGRMFGFERMALKYLHSLNNMHPDRERVEVLQRFKDELEILLTDPFERKALMLFNMPLWINSQLQGRTMSEQLRIEHEGTNMPANAKQ